MTNCWLILCALVGIGWVSTEDLRLLDLPPEEAQQYIDSKDQTLKYAPKIESNVPAVRVLGKTPTNVLEDIYLANQYHGQDGLGGYLYGYAVPDIAKTEKKKAHGDLRGEYQYINGGGQEIKVKYWDDGTGFHQTDNLPEVLPKQVEDSPDVQAAKQEFFKRWHEEAERNTHPVAPISGEQYQQQGYGTGAQSGQPFPGQYQQDQGGYGASSNQQGSYQPSQGGYLVGQGSQTSPAQFGHTQTQASSSGQATFQPSQSAPPQASYQSGSTQTQYGSTQPGHAGFQQGQSSPPQFGHVGSQTSFHPGQNAPPRANQVQTQYGPPQSGFQQGQNAPSSAGYQPSSSQYGQSCCGGAGDSSAQYGSGQAGNEWEYKPTEEEQGPPRGFFYDFNYPVGIIVQKQGEAGGVHKRESLGSLYAQNKANFDEQLKKGASGDGSSQLGYQIHA